MFTATVAYDPVTLAAPVPENTLGLYVWDEGLSTWTQEGITSTVDVEANVVTAQVSHLSTFALLGEAYLHRLPISQEFWNWPMPE